MSEPSAKRLRLCNNRDSAAFVQMDESEDASTRKRKLPTKKSKPPQSIEELIREAAEAEIIDNDYEWCTCKKETGGKMIECSEKECEIKWYHLKCENIKRIPKNDWFCKLCKEKRKQKKSVPTESITKIKKRPAESVTDATNERKKKAKIQKVQKVQNQNVLKEGNVDYSNIPDSKITKDDIEKARKRENELRLERREARGNGIKLNHLNLTNEHWLKVGRSGIHGRGVYAIKDIPEKTLLVEYTGEIISSDETDEKEKEYKKEGIEETYFFTADDEVTVIDATKGGNCSKYINHACNPNVFSKDVSKNGETKILFYAKKYIPKGEELTLDYCIQFDPKEEGRIPCNCGASNCQQFLDL